MRQNPATLKVVLKEGCEIPLRHRRLAKIDPENEGRLRKQTARLLWPAADEAPLLGLAAYRELKFSAPAFAYLYLKRMEATQQVSEFTEIYRQIREAMDYEVERTSVPSVKWFGKWILEHRKHASRYTLTSFLGRVISGECSHLLMAAENLSCLMRHNNAEWDFLENNPQAFLGDCTVTSNSLPTSEDISAARKARNMDRLHETIYQATGNPIILVVTESYEDWWAARGQKRTF